MIIRTDQIRKNTRLLLKKSFLHLWMMMALSFLILTILIMKKDLY